MSTFPKEAPMLQVWYGRPDTASGQWLPQVENCIINQKRSARLRGHVLCSFFKKIVIYKANMSCRCTCTRFMWNLKVAIKKKSLLNSMAVKTKWCYISLFIYGAYWKEDVMIYELYFLKSLGVLHFWVIIQLDVFFFLVHPDVQPNKI